MTGRLGKKILLKADVWASNLIVPVCRLLSISGSANFYHFTTILHPQTVIHSPLTT